jgi:hypothetical protein
VKPLLVVEDKVVLQAVVSLREIGVVIEVDLLILDCAPKPLYKNVGSAIDLLFS